jgi:hypothetical protein
MVGRHMLSGSSACRRDPPSPDPPSRPPERASSPPDGPSVQLSSERRRCGSPRHTRAGARSPVRSSPDGLWDPRASTNTFVFTAAGTAGTARPEAAAGAQATVGGGDVAIPGTRATDHEPSRRRRAHHPRPNRRTTIDSLDHAQPPAGPRVVPASRSCRSEVRWRAYRNDRLPVATSVMHRRHPRHIRIVTVVCRAAPGHVGTPLNPRIGRRSQPSLAAGHALRRQTWRCQRIHVRTAGLIVSRLTAFMHIDVRPN